MAHDGRASVTTRRKCAPSIRESRQRDRRSRPRIRRFIKMRLRAR